MRPISLTVADVLCEVGWPLGRDGHTACPVHQGDNRHAFHYNGALWYCFTRCGRGGNAYELRQLLIPKNKKPTRQIRGFGMPVSVVNTEPIVVPLRPSQKLMAGVQAYRDRRIDDLVDEHRYGCDLLRMAHAIQEHDPELGAQTAWRALEILEKTQRRLDGMPLGV